jgi:hypothetical protein
LNQEDLTTYRIGQSPFRIKTGPLALAGLQ